LGTVVFEQTSTTIDSDVSDESSFRTSRSFGTLATFVGATAAAIRWTASAARATGTGTSSTGSAIRTGVLLDEVGDEFLQLVLAELAIFVRVKFHRVSQHAIGIHRRSAPLSTGTATGGTLSATAGASTTGCAGAT